MLLGISMAAVGMALLPLMFWDPDPFQAAAAGDYRTVVVLVRREPELVRRTDRFGRSLLHMAALANEPRLIEFLVKSGADPNLRTKVTDAAPIHLAIRKGHAEAVAALVQVGADPNLLDSSLSDELPITMAARRGDADVVKVLLDAGVDPDARVVDPMFSKPSRICYSSTALEWAAKLGHADVVALLLDRGASVIDTEGIRPIDTILHCVARWDHIPSRYDEDAESRYERWRDAVPRVIDLIMSVLRDVNFRNSLDETPLHVAARSGNLVVVSYLIERFPELDINARQGRGVTPLESALRSQHIRRESQARNKQNPDGTYYYDFRVNRGDAIISILKAHGGRVDPSRVQHLKSFYGESFFATD
jgi:ankyrin repeat protein